MIFSYMYCGIYLYRKELFPYSYRKIHIYTFAIKIVTNMYMYSIHITQTQNIATSSNHFLLEEYMYIRHDRY